MTFTLASEDSSGFNNHFQSLVPGERPDVICRNERREQIKTKPQQKSPQNTSPPPLTYNPNDQLLGGVVPPNQQGVVDDEVARQEVGVAVNGSS